MNSPKKDIKSPEKRERRVKKGKRSCTAMEEVKVLTDATSVLCAECPV